MTTAQNVTTSEFSFRTVISPTVDVARWIIMILIAAVGSVLFVVMTQRGQGVKEYKKKVAMWLMISAMIVSVMLGGGYWYLAKTINQSNAQLADFVTANPSTTAVVAYTFDDNGNIVEDGNAIFHNADAQLVMASTMKIVVLAAYAEAVANGQLDPNEQILVTELEKYYLPLTDGKAHAQGLQSIGLATDNIGFARDPSAQLTLDQIARIMMHYSGNAETDYLIARLGTASIAAIMQKGGLGHHTPIVPTLGFSLASFNHETTFSLEKLQSAIDEVGRSDFSTLDRLLDLYLNDQAWRAAQIKFMNSLNQSTSENVDLWSYQSAASQLLPKGTAREYARFMALIASGQFISPEISAIMQRKLETVSSDNPLRLIFFNRFGAKDGATAGILTIAAYATPKRGELKNQPRVVVMIINTMPQALWTAQTQTQGHYLLPIDLIQAKGEFNRVAQIENKY